MLVGGVHIKEEDAAFLHKEASVGNGRVEVRDVIERIKGGDRSPDGAVQVQLEQVLPQEQQLAGQTQLFRLIPDNAEHLLGLVNADHIIPGLGQHQGQLPRAAAKVSQNAVPDAVGVQLVLDVLIQGVVVRCPVEFIVKVCKFVVCHLIRRPRPQTLSLWLC